MRRHALSAAVLSFGLAAFPVRASRLEAPRTLPPAARPSQPPPASAARSGRAECAELAVQVALAKARAETDELRAGASPESLFASAELIKARYTRGAGCVVTVTLPLERIRRLAGR